jgi:uncharacterized damage-inducible protein DinB
MALSDERRNYPSEAFQITVHFVNLRHVIPDPAHQTVTRMTRPNHEGVPAFYKVYVEYVKDLDVLEALQHAGLLSAETIKSIPESKGEFSYQSGKWSIKEVLNHMMDAERIFCYRALRFSRKDQTPLQPFEENDYAPLANAGSRTVQQLGEELQRLRLTTLDLYKSFSDEMLQREGTASNKRISVLNLGYIIAGHDLHHRKVLLERYLNK